LAVSSTRLTTTAPEMPMPDLPVLVEADSLELGDIGTRAREAGGTCVVEPLARGLRVSARLPLSLAG
jgi:hypothetical protein